MIALFGQLEDEFTANQGVFSTKALREATEGLIGHGMKAALNLAAGGLINFDTASLKSTAGKMLDSYSAERKSREEVRRQLLELTNEVKKATNHPLILIIDELDRCRPTFSVELLERVKHVLNVPNLVVVFGVDRVQLGKAVQSIYGQVNVDGYLARFFDLEISLPNVGADAYCRQVLSSTNLAGFLNERSAGPSKGVQLSEYHNFCEFLPVFCSAFSMSLREVERIIQRVIWFLRGIPATKSMHPALLSALVVLRMRNTELHSKFIGGQATPGAVLDWLFSELDSYAIETVGDGMLDFLEIQVYGTACRTWRNDPVLEQLDLLLDREELTHSEMLSCRTREKDVSDLNHFRQMYTNRRPRGGASQLPFFKDLVGLASRLELAAAIE